MRKIITIALIQVAHLSAFIIGCYFIKALPEYDSEGILKVIWGVLWFIIIAVSTVLITTYKFMEGK